MKIRTQISLSLFTVLSFLFVMSGVIYKESASLHLMRQKVVISRNLLIAASDFKGQVRNRILSTFRAAFIEETKRTQQKLVSDKKNTEEKLETFKKSYKKEEHVHANLRENGATDTSQINELFELYYEMDKSLAKALNFVQQKKTGELKQLLKKISDESFASFLEKINTIIVRETSEIENETIRTERSISRLNRMAVVFPGLAFCLALIMIYWISKSITIPLEKLDRATKSISEGKFDLSIPSVGSDEFSQLSKAFNQMTSALKQSQEKLEQQQQTIIQSSKLASLGEMAGGIAHEINTPLTAIILKAEMIEIKNSKLEVPSPNISSLTKSIIDISYRIEKIIKNLKGFSRDGKDDNLENFSIRQLINDTLNLCGERFKINNVKIVIDENNIDAVVCSKMIQVSQCLLNLLNNSFDAIKNLDEKWIQLFVTIRNKKLELRVIDSGKPISEQACEKIFQPFYTTKSLDGGTGLGLSISKSIMKNLDGDLFYDEKNPHACFVIQLPYNEKEEER